jgi:hypothetical protein
MVRCPALFRVSPADARAATALHHAAANGFFTVLSLLLAGGYEPMQVDSDQRLPVLLPLPCTPLLAGD